MHTCHFFTKILFMVGVSACICNDSVQFNKKRYLFPFREDDIRMKQNIGAKFIGRSMYRWSEESKLGVPVFLEYTIRMIDRMHEFDPEIIFQACIFESVSNDVNNIAISAWVYKAYNLPVEKRNFNATAMLEVGHRMV